MFACSSEIKPIDFLGQISSREDFDLLKGEPLSQNYGGIECVKVVYVLKNQKIYYLQSRKYKWHNRFTSEILGDTDDLETFNELNYGDNPDRKYILATFNYNISTKNYFLQFAAPDNISEELIQTLVNKVESTFYLKNKFKILLNTTTLLKRKASLEKKFNTITGDEMFKTQQFQAISKGIGKGNLVFIHADSIKFTTDYSNSILVISGNTNEIPVCKGIITDQFQTPLSHISLLTMNRRIPCAFLQNCFLSDSIRKLSQQFVELNVNAKEMKLSVSVKSNDFTKGFKETVLKYDSTKTLLADLSSLSHKSKTAYGAKAANLAELKKLETESKVIATPEKAFAIPFYYYLQHIKTNGIQALIQQCISNTNSTKTDIDLENQLKQIRKQITETSLNPAFLKALTDKCKSNYQNNKIRFRSSSNAEDNSNFNGAGLYTSTTGIVGDEKKSIEKAVKKVWASLWTLKAFKERAYFNINQNHAAMAILVHQAFDDEIINGVAITKNLYRSYEAGIVINIQKGEEEVVSPKANVISEQVISYMNVNASFYDNTRSADWISYSSLSPNESLITTEELFELTKQLERIKNHFYNKCGFWSKYNYSDFAMDVEFKLILDKTGKRKFIIKQARPFLN